MSATVAARKILTGLHELMATRLSAQDKLDRTVEIVGESLDSEVCSIYLLRGGMLELSATRGLNQSAVHVTRLAVGEGLTGTLVAHGETLNLAQANAAPAAARACCSGGPNSGGSAPGALRIFYHPNTSFSVLCVLRCRGPLPFPHGCP